jgi:hypothetical protein
MESDNLATTIELGDLISIYMNEDPPFTGNVIFCSTERIRVKDSQSRTTGKEYLLDETGEIKEEYGVWLVEIHKKSEYYHFSAMIGAQPGETVEFFSLDGTPAIINPETNETSGVISELIATDSEDALILTNGIRLDFGGVGPDPSTGIAIIVPTATESVSEEATEEQMLEQQQEERTEIFQFESIEQLLREIMPTAVIEEIPSAERFYPDPIQRQDMYNDFVMDLTPDKQKNVKALREVSQLTEYLLALKQSTVKLNVANRPIGVQKSTFETLGDVVNEVNTSYIPACVPIYDIKRTLYLDTREMSPSQNILFKYIMDVEYEDNKRLELYENGEMATNGIAFYSYLDSVFQLARITPGSFADEGAVRDVITYEQEGYIAPEPGTIRSGFEKGLPHGYESSFAHSFGKSIVPLTGEFLTSVRAQTSRFLPSIRASAHKLIPAGTVSQPADQVITTGYVILDTPSILHARTLVNIPSLMTRIQIADYQRERRVQKLADLDPVAVTDANSQSHSLMLTKEQVAAATPEFWEIWIRNNLYRTISPIHGFSPASPLLAVALDAFVPNRSDYPKPLQDEIWKFIDQNMKLWTQASGASRQRIMKKLADGVTEGESYGAIIEHPNTLNKRILEDVFLNILIKNLNEKETILRNNPQVIMAEFEKGFGSEAFIQYATILTQLEGREPVFDPQFLKSKLEDIIRSEQNRNTIAADEAKRSGSKPQINSCEHVRFLVAVRRSMNRGRDHSVYIELFKEFLSKFQGPREGNWIMCQECKKELVCVHEIMTLNEVLHPGRALSLHKKLLIEYGGPVFEGHYTCKNCGIPIQEIEYDTHIEFDDEGRPISGRSVIVDDERKALDLNEIVSRKEVQYPTEDETKLYQIIKVISERAGAADISKEIMDRMIHYAQVYLKEKVPPRDQYEQQIQALKIRGTRGKLPSYEEYSRNQRIGVIATLFVIELQTASPPILIRFPFTQCRFSIQGFPTEGMNPDEVGSGALDYVTCCVASIQRREDPWSSTSWSLLPDLEKRQDIIKKMIVTMTNLLLGSSKSGMQLHISGEIRTAIRKRVESLKLEQRKERASAKDTLPTGFMPEPFVQFPQNVVNEPTSADPNQAIAAMNIAGTDGPRKNLLYRLSVVYSQLKLESYKKAEKDGMIIYGSDRSDSFSSPISLKDIKRGALQVLGLVPLEEEARRLAMALRTIELRTPTSTPAGTHIWTPWTPREIPVLKVEIPKNILYKLFLRNCYKGPTIGSPHKIGYGNACKNCGFQFPVSPDIIDPEKEGKPALDNQNVDYSETEFEKILAARRELRSQASFVKPDEPELLKNIQQWISSPVMVDDAGLWQEIAKILKGLYDSKTASRPIARAEAWGDFVARYDLAKEALRARVAASATRKTRAQAVAAGFLNSLDIVTQNPFGTGCDSIASALVSPLLQKARAHMISSVTSLREVKDRAGAEVLYSHATVIKRPGKEDKISLKDVKPWMKIAPEHKSLLNEIMTQHTELINGGSLEMREVCNRLGREIGLWMRKWKTLIFEEPLLGFTEMEGQYILRFVFVRLFLDITNTSSSLYKNLPTDATVQKPESETVMKEVVVFIAENMERTASTSRLPSQKELEEILLKRAETERNYVINIFDRLDDEDKAIEKLQKKFRLGKWAMGQNVRDYSAELYEHDRNQRIQMGLRDAPQLTEGRSLPGDFGFASFGGESRADRAYGVEDLDAQERAETSVYMD